MGPKDCQRVTQGDRRVVIGEMLDRMDMEWEEQYKDLTLTMKPSA